MKILYGIQGTGNGHISRARMMAQHFSKTSAEVDWLFSGRDSRNYFDMEIFGDYQTRSGLTFVAEAGQLHYLKTASANKPFIFIKDVMALPVVDYDIVLTDFEPITAWACKLRGMPCIGIGHQYAFDQPNIPTKGAGVLSRLIMSAFAPVSTGIGLHWDHFSAHGEHRIVPPIIPPALRADEQPCDHVLVYLPFEDQREVTQVLQSFGKQQFIQYSPELEDGSSNNVLLRAPSNAGFKHDLKSARAVICNCGFELVSECLHLGVAALTLPVRKQMEQLSNGAALRQLGLATVIDDLVADSIADWLENIPETSPVSYPDVAKALVDWVLAGNWERPERLAAQLWANKKNRN